MNPEETLAVWRAEESKVRERLARTTGYARAEQLDGRSGLETLQAIFALKVNIVRPLTDAVPLVRA